ERPVLILTDDGRAVMKGQRPARLLLPPAGRDLEIERVRPAAGPVAARPASALGAPADEEIFQALRRERLRLAREEAVAPFMVASDRTLREIAQLRPRTLDELRIAHGIRALKLDRYGPARL